MNRTRRPTHPGIAFNELVLAPLGRSTEDAAKAMGVCRSYSESVLSGDVPVTRVMAKKMDRYTNTPADSWMSIQTILDEWERDEEMRAQTGKIFSVENIRAEVEKTREILDSNPMPFGRPAKNRSISSNVHYAELHDGTLDKKAIKKVSDSLGGKRKSWLRRLFSWK